MIRIVLAEDHEIVRRGLRALVEQKTGYRIVAETGDGLEAVELVGAEQPDVLVVDLRLPGLDGLEVVREARKKQPELKVVVLSMHDNEAYVVRALRHGASAYVLKDASADDLVEAIGEAMAGRTFFSKGISRDLIDAYTRGEMDQIEDRYDTLTSRERQVLHLLAQGFTGPEIAEKLFISPRTVDTHRANLVSKLGLRNQAELVRYVVERGLVPPSSSSSSE